MKTLYYDCFCGISGDMHLAALLDLGVDEMALRRELSKLGIDDEYELEIERASRKGISGTQLHVRLTGAAAHETAAVDTHHHQHHQQHQHQHHHHEDHHHAADDSAHLEPAAHSHAHGERNLAAITELIERSALSAAVKRRSVAMFLRIAEAEAKVHGKTVDEVHFHEVGATDSIVDIVGAAICLEELQVDEILASPVQLGGGFVRCAHGLMPVPAPATAEILTGLPIKSGLVQDETTTPTGAAILAANVNRFSEELPSVIERIGYGVGHKDFEVPNVLRVYLAQTQLQAAKQVVLATNIDDMNPEWFGRLEEKLLAAGALDVWRTSIVMKKGRLAVQLSVLIDSEREAELTKVLFAESTAIGLRRQIVDKVMLERKLQELATPWGTVRIKHSYYQGLCVTSKPEYEDCVRAAEQSGLPLARIYREIARLTGEDDE